MTTFHLTISFSYENLYLRDGNNTTPQRLRAEGRGQVPGSKPSGGMEQMNRRGTQELTPSVTSEKEAHIGGWFKSRSQPYRSLTIERDEAPDPDVKHIAGEATGTRAERDTVGTIK